MNDTMARCVDVMTKGRASDDSEEGGFTMTRYMVPRCAHCSEGCLTPSWA
jgi:hypothetical protein